MDRSRYFDHAATTPVDPRVLEVMLPYLTEVYGNAHSLHDLGRAARHGVERAREQVAHLLGAEDPAEVVFTSGATESNHAVLQQFSRVACSPFEHSSIREPVLARGGWMLSAQGYALEPSTLVVDLLAVMAVNNETGASLEPPSVADSTPILCDLTQAVGRIPLPEWRYDFGSLSAHKIYGPKGVGALWIRGARPIEPWVLGGGQENGLRAGTLNVPGIVGMGAAAQLAFEEQGADHERARLCREAALDALGNSDDILVHEHTQQSPFILSLSFRGVEGETLVIELDQAGYAISSGAACSSGTMEPSHVLSALKLSEEWSRGTVRVSFGRANTPEGSAALGKALREKVGTLRRRTLY